MKTHGIQVIQMCQISRDVSAKKMSITLHHATFPAAHLEILHIGESAEAESR